MAQPLFPAWFNPHRRAPKPPAKTFAVFPGGHRAEIVRRPNPYNRKKTFQVTRPDGEIAQNDMLRDLKHFLDRDFPGVRFERETA